MVKYNNQLDAEAMFDVISGKEGLVAQQLTFNAVILSGPATHTHTHALYDRITHV